MSALTTGMIGLRNRRVGKAKRAHHQHSRKQWWARFALPTLQDPTVVRRSRSLWNLENQTRRRRMREQPAFGVGDARLGGGGAAADAERLALAANGAGILGHALDEGNLEFERGVAGAGGQ